MVREVENYNKYEQQGNVVLNEEHQLSDTDLKDGE